MNPPLFLPSTLSPIIMCFYTPPRQVSPANVQRVDRVCHPFSMLCRPETDPQAVV